MDGRDRHSRRIIHCILLVEKTESEAVSTQVKARAQQDGVQVANGSNMEVQVSRRRWRVSVIESVCTAATFRGLIGLTGGRGGGSTAG